MTRSIVSIYSCIITLLVQGGGYCISPPGADRCASVPVPPVGRASGGILAASCTFA